jgi:hypothetical protein
MIIKLGNCKKMQRRQKKRERIRKYNEEVVRTADEANRRNNKGKK